LLKDGSISGPAIAHLEMDLRLPRVTGSSGERLRDANIKVRFGERNPELFTLVAALPNGHLAASIGEPLQDSCQSRPPMWAVCSDFWIFIA